MMMDKTRSLEYEKALGLEGGENHYLAYVGPPGQYDLMGATQFRLLTTLGLRTFHKLLDIGCGSLRLGRLLIPYLRPGNYFGIEPNVWLIDDAIRYELGNDIIKLKRPHFSNNGQFRCNVFEVMFEYVIAQSIFSHAGLDLIEKCLIEVAKVLTNESVFVATFVHGDIDFKGNGWVYPEVVTYRPETISSVIESASLKGIEIPWYHPRQTWYVMARNAERLPQPDVFSHLCGSVLFDEEMADSIPR